MDGDGRSGLRQLRPGGSAVAIHSVRGETKLNIRLSNGATGVLTIFCVLGSPPPSREEGITVILGAAGQSTKQHGGNTVFIHS